MCEKWRYWKKSEVYLFGKRFINDCVYCWHHILLSNVCHFCRRLLLRPEHILNNIPNIFAIFSNALESSPVEAVDAGLQSAAGV